MRCNGAKHWALFIVFSGAAGIAGCSGSSAPCQALYVGSAGAIYGQQVSPSDGATGVPTSVRTLVFLNATDYPIVLRPVGGASTATIQTTPTALPSPYVNTAGTSEGYYAVTVPLLGAGTTYATGTLTDNNQCAGHYYLYQLGTFTTQ